MWRCISYWKFGFSNVMLVCRGVIAFDFGLVKKCYLSSPTFLEQFLLSQQWRQNPPNIPKASQASQPEKWSNPKNERRKKKVFQNTSWRTQGPLNSQFFGGVTFPFINQNCLGFHDPFKPTFQKIASFVTPDLSTTLFVMFLLNSRAAYLFGGG